jgi:hypothetical protein
MTQPNSVTSHSVKDVRRPERGRVSSNLWRCCRAGVLRAVHLLISIVVAAVVVATVVRSAIVILLLIHLHLLLT